MDPSCENAADRADLIELTIERPAVGGRMIARWEGRVVLVAGAIPGEQVRAVLEGARGGALLARTLDVTRPSPDRRPVDAPASCGGRTLAHVAYPRQLVLKGEIVRDAFRRIGRIDLPKPPAVVGSPETGYRMRARLHAGDGGVGFLDEGSHRVCAVAGTGVLSPGAERVAAALNARVSELLASGVRTIELAEDLPGDRCVLHLTVQGAASDARARWEGLAEAAGVSGLSAASRTVPGPPHVVGRPFVTDPVAGFLPAPRVGGLVLRRHANAFFQANRHLVPELTAAVAELAGDGEVIDLYAGVGLFAVALAARGGARVTAVERDPVGAADSPPTPRPRMTACALPGASRLAEALAAGCRPQRSSSTRRAPASRARSSPASHAAGPGASSTSRATSPPRRATCAPCGRPATASTRSARSTCSPTRPTSRRWSPSTGRSGLAAAADRADPGLTSFLDAAVDDRCVPSSRPGLRTRTG